MKYIAHRRFKGLAICGDVNIPATTACDCCDNAIICKGNMICYVDSETGHQYFAVNEDGMGLVRGHLTQAIQNRLAKTGAGHQERWDKVWADDLCMGYKERNNLDDWHWNDAFFSAPVEDLKYIAKLVGAKEG